MKVMYMMLSGLVLSIIATLALTAVLSVSALFKPKSHNDAAGAKKDMACMFYNAEDNTAANQSGKVIAPIKK